MGMDPFEEFEFKPLTEGLGFHQNPQKNQAPPAAPASFPSTDQFKGRGLDFKDTSSAKPEGFGSQEISKSEIVLKAPLPRRELKSQPSMQAPTPNLSPVDDILNTLQKNRKIEIELDRQQRKDLRQPQKTESWVETSPKIAPMLLDGMLITAASLLCLILMLIVTRVDLITNLSNPDTEGFVYLSTLSLVAGVSFIYMVVHRVFLGFTPGEWAYELRVGPPGEQGKALFSLKLIGRQLLVTLTGLILLPLLGVILGKDLAGKATGAVLSRKK